MKSVFNKMAMIVSIAGKTFVKVFRSIEQCVINSCDLWVSKAKVIELEAELYKQKTEIEKLGSKNSEDKKQLQEQSARIESDLKEQINKKDIELKGLRQKYEVDGNH